MLKNWETRQVFGDAAKGKIYVPWFLNWNYTSRNQRYFDLVCYYLSDTLILFRRVLCPFPPWRFGSNHLISFSNALYCRGGHQEFGNARYKYLAVCIPLTYFRSGLLCWPTAPSSAEVVTCPSTDEAPLHLNCSDLMDAGVINMTVPFGFHRCFWSTDKCLLVIWTSIKHQRKAHLYLVLLHIWERKWDEEGRGKGQANLTGWMCPSTKLRKKASSSSVCWAWKWDAVIIFGGVVGRLVGEWEREEKTHTHTP